MTHPDDLPCPECGRPLGQHTVIEYREHTATMVPFEEIPDPIPTGADGQVLVDHLDAAAVVVEMHTQVGTIHLPAVEFRFWSSSGARPAPLLFVADDERMFKDLGRLVAGACGAAPMRARQANRRQT